MRKKTRFDKVEFTEVESQEEDSAKPAEPSSIEVLFNKLQDAPAEEAENFQEVSVFKHLEESRVGGQNSWELELATEKVAAFSWMQKSLLLVLHLDQKLQPKRSRKSVGRVVHHWTISKIEFLSCHRDTQSEANIETNILDAGE